MNEVLLETEGVKINDEGIINIRHADDTVVIATTESDLEYDGQDYGKMQSIE